MSATPAQSEAAADEAIKSLAESLHPIPPMTDPMGQHWSQPSRFDIVVDDTHALMNHATLKKLADYSASMPSGVYHGKMWRRRVDYYDEAQGWRLVWYGNSPTPGQCSVNHRLILLA